MVVVGGGGGAWPSIKNISHADNIISQILISSSGIMLFGYNHPPFPDRLLGGALLYAC